MITFIKERENPAQISSEVRLHNILSWAIMTEDVRRNLLEVMENGRKLYQVYRRERYCEKTKAISATILLFKLSTFKTVYTELSQSDNKKER